MEITEGTNVRVAQKQKFLLPLVIMFIALLAGCLATLPDAGDGGDGGSGATVVVREYPITHGEDHGWVEVRVDSGEVRVASSPAAIWFGGSRYDYDADAIFRWRNVDIPRGATILEAKVVMWHRPVPAGQGINQKPVKVDIHGFAYGNLPRFSQVPDPTQLERTEASVLWVIEQPWSTKESQMQETPDLREIIQEIVNRPDWKAGNALGIAFDTGAHRNAERYHREICVLDSLLEDCQGTNAPLLYVRFQR